MNFLTMKSVISVASLMKIRTDIANENFAGPSQIVELLMVT